MLTAGATLLSTYHELAPGGQHLTCILSLFPTSSPFILTTTLEGSPQRGKLSLCKEHLEQEKWSEAEGGAPSVAEQSECAHGPPTPPLRLLPHHPAWISLSVQMKYLVSRKD